MQQQETSNLNKQESKKQEIKPEDMPEFQDVLSQSVIKGWRERYPNITNEEIIETLMAW